MHLHTGACRLFESGTSNYELTTTQQKPQSCGARWDCYSVWFEGDNFWRAQFLVLSAKNASCAESEINRTIFHAWNYLKQTLPEISLTCDAQIPRGVNEQLIVARRIGRLSLIFIASSIGTVCDGSDRRKSDRWIMDRFFVHDFQSSHSPRPRARDRGEQIIRCEMVEDDCQNGWLTVAWSSMPPRRFCPVESFFASRRKCHGSRDGDPAPRTSFRVVKL